MTIPICEVRKVTVAEVAFAPNLPALLDAYAAEAKNKDLPPHRPNMAAYEQMERIGLLHAFGAYNGDDLVGLLTMLVTVIPHYDARMATVESFYVADDYRKGGTGQRLLDAAEAYAKLEGVLSFFVSAPIGGRLAQALPMLGYRETNRVFFRSLR
jgi:GNAT superfamily N-acetyltransferase